MKTFEGLSERHVGQIIRRKMIQKVKPSSKVYDRNKGKKVRFLITYVDKPPIKCDI